MEKWHERAGNVASKCGVIIEIISENNIIFYREIISETNISSVSSKCGGENSVKSNRAVNRSKAHGEIWQAKRQRHGVAKSIEGGGENNRRRKWRKIAWRNGSGWHEKA
jgi:hypothetical protein